MNTVKVKPLLRREIFYDWLMWPIMKAVMLLTTGDMRECPQRTHFWNNMKGWSWNLDTMLFVAVQRDHGASCRWLGKLPFFHLGGWREYVVLEQESNTAQWFVGWKATDVTGVSRIPLCGSVRLLRGDGAVDFFGLDGEGTQIPLKIVGYGRLGDRSKYRRVPLR